jgi:sulfate transport system ATP-binding protein
VGGPAFAHPTEIMSITLDQVTKRYQGTPVVNDVSLELAKGEFFVLLGPSGSGKSTLLRAIAGLTGVDHGHVYLHGRDVTQVPARERGVGMVFQNYALFRHMSVADNIEFALRVRGVRAAERRARRQELLRLVALEGMDERLPTQLSGGQQQRVAVARALAHRPEVLLLDEPFGALDAKIRDELRRTIRHVQRELGITTVLVTHDQQEAFELADRIAVMNLGHVLEVGAPADLYARPATRFVATFLGAANLLLVRAAAAGHDGQEAVAVVRPEEVELAADAASLRSPAVGDGLVEEVVFSGGQERLRVKFQSAPAAGSTLRVQEGPVTIEVTRTQPERRAFGIISGQQVAVGFRHVHLLGTPLSSFTACAPSAAAAEELAHEPFLVELSQRMRTRVGAHVVAPGAEAVAPSGVPVLASGEQTLNQAVDLLEAGSGQVMVLRPGAGAPRRVLVHWADGPVRRATLACAASFLRHVEAEALYLSVVPEGAEAGQRFAALRGLLDARTEAHALHGLQLRTELSTGTPAAALERALRAEPRQMLILGASDPAAFTGEFASLVSPGNDWHVLLVTAAAERQDRAA